MELIINFIPKTLLCAHRVILGIPEVAWNGMGSMWIIMGQVMCQDALSILMKGEAGLVSSQGCLFVFVVMFFYIMVC